MCCAIYSSASTIAIFGPYLRLPEEFGGLGESPVSRGASFHGHMKLLHSKMDQSLAREWKSQAHSKSIQHAPTADRIYSTDPHFPQNPPLNQNTSPWK
jgi:hypothetical protein